ncbi:hypothetical protein Vid5_gp77 [Pantoea phage vB_PagS_Vid5]|uniref:Uncharacterized protein n=1 Tax=Pantoea phage vB_PagS_Vid5 TaxID=2099652 RepID=A0A2P1CKW1_9CAUD|nr:hypothetical protein FDJ45_gp078 [Pantoea phage vB_PagS_Vid5]AVJ51832.1 hypothetical protein Vid5_gp77 [Pantoea phage vB_PagS_Vid5]
MCNRLTLNAGGTPMFATNIKQFGSNTVIEFDVSEETFQTEWKPQLWLKENTGSRYGFDNSVQLVCPIGAKDVNDRSLRIACCTLGQEILELWGHYPLATLLAEYRYECRVYSSAVPVVRRAWGQNILGHCQRVWEERLVRKSSKVYRNAKKVRAIGEYDADDTIQYAVFITGCRNPGWYNPEVAEHRISPQVVVRPQWFNTPHIVLPETTVSILRELMS